MTVNEIHLNYLNLFTTLLLTTDNLVLNKVKLCELTLNFEFFTKASSIIHLIEEKY